MGSLKRERIKPHMAAKKEADLEEERANAAQGETCTMEEPQRWLNLLSWQAGVSAAARWDTTKENFQMKKR